MEQGVDEGEVQFLDEVVDVLSVVVRQEFGPDAQKTVEVPQLQLLVKGSMPVVVQRQVGL